MNEHDNNQSKSVIHQSKTPILLKRTLKIFLIINLPLLLLPNTGLMLPTWSWIELWNNHEVITGYMCLLSTYELMFGFPISFVGAHGNNSCTTVLVFNIVGLLLTLLFSVTLAYAEKFQPIASRRWLKMLLLISVVIVIAFAIKASMTALTPFSYPSFY